MPEERPSQGSIEYRLVGTGPVVMVLKGGHSSRLTRLGHERLAEDNFSVLEPSRPGYDGKARSVGCTAQSPATALPRRPRASAPGSPGRAWVEEVADGPPLIIVELDHHAHRPKRAARPK